MRKTTIMLILISLLLLTSCSKKFTPTYTTTRPITTTTQRQTTTTSTTSTTSAPTTTFHIPLKGKLCAELYSEDLAKMCGNSKDINFYIIASESGLCSIGGNIDDEDVLYITVTNYNVVPYKGMDPYRQPRFTLSKNIAVNETGEISARYVNQNLNEVAFVRDYYLVEVKTWIDNKPLTCSSLEALEIAKIMNKNILAR